MNRITICISTKNRRHILHQALWSLRNQTYPYWDLVIVDDSSEFFSLDSWEKDGFYQYILSDIRKKHKAVVISSPKTGKVGAAFQEGFLYATKHWHNPLFCRCDDDVWLEPTYLEKLIPLFKDKSVGGVSGLCLSPGKDIPVIPANDEKYKIWGSVEYITSSPNLQWFRHESSQPFEVQFFHSVQILRTDLLKLIGGFDTQIFKNYREENHLSWRIYKEGYKLLVNPKAECWHLRSPVGGTRSGENTWVDDARKFSLVKKTMEPGIHISLSHAIGDLIMATPAIELLKQKYPTRNLSVWHPYAKEVLEGNPHIDVICENMWDAQRTMRIEESVYAFASKHQWDGHLTNCYCKIFGVYEIDNPIPKLYNVEPLEGYGNYVLITNDSNAKIYDLSNNSYTKYWLADRWEEIVNWVRSQYNLEVIQLSKESPLQPINGARQVTHLSLRDAFRLIKGAKLLLSIDTMAAHAAAALDVPAVVLWGKTSPHMYGYIKPNIINLAKDCPKNRPCQGGSMFQQDIMQCPISDHPCMDHTIEDVKNAIMNLMEEICL